MTIVGASAVSLMALAYTLEQRHRGFIATFATACVQDDDAPQRFHRPQGEFAADALGWARTRRLLTVTDAE